MAACVILAALVTQVPAFGNPVFILALMVVSLYVSVAYLWYGLFAGLSGSLTISPTKREMKFALKYFGFSLDQGRIPWEDKLKLELETKGLKSNSLPFGLYRVNLKTKFRDYTVASFGPRQQALANSFAKAVNKARKPQEKKIEDSLNITAL